MNKTKKLLMVLVVLACLLAPVLAVQTMSVTWTWNHDDQDVNYYRYQMNGEIDDEWTVVPNTVLSYSATELDPYLGYTLYLQCSYDGENWSESAIATAEPLLVKEVEEATVVEPEVVPEESAIAEEVVPVEEETVEVVESEVATTVEETTAPEKKSSYGYKTNLLISGGVATNVSFDKFALTGAFPRFSIALEFQNIVHAGPWGLGLRFDVNTILEPREQDWDNFRLKDTFKKGGLWYDNSVDGKLMMYLGNDSFDFYLGPGIGWSFMNPHFANDVDQKEFGHSLKNLGIFSTAWFVSGNVGMRVRFNDLFSLGVEANYRYLLPAEKHTASADLVFGFTF